MLRGRDSSLESFLREQGLGVEGSSEGAFTLSGPEAVKKLAQFSLKHPAQWF